MYGRPLAHDGLYEPRLRGHDRDRLVAEVARLTAELEQRDQDDAGDFVLPAPPAETRTVWGRVVRTEPSPALVFEPEEPEPCANCERLRAALEAVGEELAPWSMAQTGSGIYHHAIHAGMIARTALATPAQE